MILFWRALGGVVALLAMWIMVFLTDAPSLVEPAPDGLLRLSWRTVGERIERCRPPTEDDLAALPRHMRPKEICEGRLAAFELIVRIDGETVVEREVRPAGVREDRPIYVFEEQRVAPGLHRVEVSFSRLGGAADQPESTLELNSDLDVAARSVVLITRDRESGDLVVRDRVMGS